MNYPTYFKQLRTYDDLSRSSYSELSCHDCKRVIALEASIAIIYYFFIVFVITIPILNISSP